MYSKATKENVRMALLCNRILTIRLLPTTKFCLAFIIVSSAVTSYFWIIPSTFISNNSSSIKQNSQDSRETKMKTILFWTPYYNQSHFGVGFGQSAFIQAGCQWNNCITTADRNLLNRSDAVIFHGFQFKIEDLPPFRNANQRFVFFLYETIPNTSLPCVGKCLPEYPPSYFNWTMTHRRDSDVYVATAYGAIALKRSVTPVQQLPNKLPPGRLPADPAVVLNREFIIANKTNMIAWFASHCPTHSRREDYIQELAKYVQVDIYGRCGKMKCLPYSNPRCKRLLTTYKFYLAVENSLCPDYVTEKFYRALMNNVVPIVYGGADYTEYAPPHSYINLADFKSPKHLADYLKMLDKNDALYMEYFQWKKQYQVINNPMNGWCDLCAKLNEPKQESKNYEDVVEWWVRKLPCYVGSSFLHNRIGKTKR